MNLLYCLRVYSFFNFCLIVEGFNNILNALKLKRKNRATLAKSLDGKVAVITGVSSGIGKITALTFAKLGATVIMACRDSLKSQKSFEDICNELDNDKKSNITLVTLDLSSLMSVRSCAERINSSVSQIDYLINNAGIMMCPEWKSEDGYDLQFATNYLGHFLLTNLLLDKLKAAPSARIVNISSMAHYTGQIHFDNINLIGKYTPLNAYTQSKLAIVLFTQELAIRLKGTNVTTYSVHPGMINTDLFVYFTKIQKFFLNMWKRLILISPELGAQTTLHCALDEQLKHESGLYYANCRQIRRRLPHTVNQNDAAKLWELSAKLCNTCQDQNNNVNNGNKLIFQINYNYSYNNEDANAMI